MKNKLFWISILLLSQSGTGMAASRDEVIARALDCQNSSGKISWSEVCQTTPSATMLLAQRETAIDNALKSAATVESPESMTDSEPLAAEPASAENLASQPIPAHSGKRMAVSIDADGNVSTQSPASNSVTKSSIHEKKIVSPSSDKKAALNEDVLFTEAPTSLDTTFEEDEYGFFWPHFDRSDPRSKWDFGINLFSYEYTEPNFAELEGAMGGVFLTYDYRWRINRPVSTFKELADGTNSLNLFRFEGRFDFGSLKYWSNGTGEDKGIPNYSFELRGLFGYDIPFAKVYQVTPYAGIGYRYLLDDQGGQLTSTGAQGYDRESSYVYLPLGADIQKRLTETLTCRLNLEGDIFLSGMQKSHFEDVSLALGTLENKQNSGYGLRSSFRVTKETSALDYFVEPFLRYWKISDSEIATVNYAGVALGYALEPANETTEWGIRLGVRY